MKNPKPKIVPTRKLLQLHNHLFEQKPGVEKVMCSVYVWKCKFENKNFFLFKNFISKLINIMIHSVNFTLKEQTFPTQSTKRRLYFETLNIVFVSLFPVIIFKAVRVCYEKF